MDERIKNINFKKFASSVAIGLIAIIIIFGSVGTIGAGERGVLLRFGAVRDKIFDEGLYFKIPLLRRRSDSMK